MQEDRLKPFGFSESYFGEGNNTANSKLSTENALLLLLGLIFAQSVIYFAVDFFRRTDMLDVSYQDIGLIYGIGNGLFNFILLIICLLIKPKRGKILIVSLALVQIAIFIYYLSPKS